jgi:hypothetical protein
MSIKYKQLSTNLSQKCTVESSSQKAILNKL